MMFRSSPSRALHRISWLLLAATLWLILWGGYTNSLKAGMAFPDWPTSDGHMMFFLPWGEWGDWTGQKFWEHSHRLIAAGIVGPLTLLLFFWTLFTLPRGVWRNLAALAVLTVIIQGLLGALTVKESLSIKGLSIAHAGLAQVFVGLVAVFVTATSPSWRQEATPLNSRIFAWLPIFVLGQTLLGALYRHLGETRWLMWHLTGALIFAIAIFWAAIVILTDEKASRRLKNAAGFLLALLLGQLTLGVVAWIQRTRTAEMEIVPWFRAHMASIHVLLGSVFMVACVYVYLHARRPSVLSSGQRFSSDTTVE